MPTENKKEIFEGLKDLPKDVQDAIMSMDNAKIIEAVGKKNGLNLEQISVLAEEVGALMGGHAHPKDFIKNIREGLSVSDDLARAVAQEVNQQIFSKVRESLKKIHEVGEGPEKKTEAPVIPEPVAPKPSPFEQKLEDKVFAPPIKQELDQAQKESRYPDSADPYREPSN